jgi:hypothetical protein
MLAIRIAAVMVLPLLASCASSGLYNMTEEWCERHVEVSAARCPEHQESADPQQRVAANEVGRN